ncbi:MAG: hypothetical protein AAFY11_07565 [Cyanobacteria bacterium J06641_5]
MSETEQNQQGLECENAEALVQALSARYEGLGKTTIYEMKKVIAGFFPQEKLTKALTAEQLAFMDELNEHRKAGGQLDKFALVSLAIAEEVEDNLTVAEEPPEVIDLTARFAVRGEQPAEANPIEMDAVMREAASMAVGQEISVQELAALYRQQPQLMPQEYQEAFRKAKKQGLRVLPPQVHANRILQGVAAQMAA